MKKLIIATALCVTAIVATPAIAQEDDGAELAGLNAYLDLAEQYVDLASDPDTAVFFAVQGIVEIHTARGERSEAVEALQALIERYPDNQAARNIIRFELRDLHQERGDVQAALAELDAVLEENR